MTCITLRGHPLLIPPPPHLLVSHKLKTPEVFRKAMLAMEPYMMRMKEDCQEWNEVNHGWALWELSPYY